MSNKYRKKPVVIEAYQITQSNRTNLHDWPDWLVSAWCKDAVGVTTVYPTNFPDSDGTDQLQINTLEGKMTVGWDDFIIQGVSGELYACKPGIFEKTYEAVS